MSTQSTRENYEKKFVDSVFSASCLAKFEMAEAERNDVEFTDMAIMTEDVLPPEARREIYRGEVETLRAEIAKNSNYISAISTNRSGRGWRFSDVPRVMAEQATHIVAQEILAKADLILSNPSMECPAHIALADVRPRVSDKFKSLRKRPFCRKWLSVARKSKGPAEAEYRYQRLFTKTTTSYWAKRFHINLLSYAFCVFAILFLFTKIADLPTGLVLCGLLWSFTILLRIATNSADCLPLLSSYLYFRRERKEANRALKDIRKKDLKNKIGTREFVRMREEVMQYVKS